MANAFSIITVTKNNASGLQSTIDSISSQNYSHYELIVIDGNSTDNTIQVLEQNTQKIHQYISETDSGIYDAMNKGIQLAKNQWGLFLNAGDVFINLSVLQDISNFITNQSILPELIFGKSEELFRGQIIIRDTCPISTMPVNMPACHQSMFISTKLLKSNMYNTDFKICGDLELIARILHQSPSVAIAYYDKPIARVEGEGISNKLWNITYRERKKVQKLYYHTPQHAITLQLFYIKLLVKKTLRSLMPISLQLRIRKLIYKNNN